MAAVNIKSKRKIIRINEEKCNGCGLCSIACAEGALQIINGKAKLISEKYCDGLGACIGECPQGALIITEEAAEEFDEKAVEHHLKQKEAAPSPCGCASSTATQFETRECASPCCSGTTRQEAMLRHWPVQLTLVPATAPFLQGADLVLTADCVPFAYANFHNDFIKDHSVLVACPKLDDFDRHQAKLEEILLKANLKSLTVVRMEVPCCSGLTHMVKQAVISSKKDIPVKEVIVEIKGGLKS
jgi:NAD-dependent dihydropyrimidine dehydrogenase PreA subunit